MTSKLFNINIRKIFICLFLFLVFVVVKTPENIYATSSDVTGKIYMMYNGAQFPLKGVIIQSKSRFGGINWASYKTDDQGVYHMRQQRKEGGQWKHDWAVYNTDYSRPFTDPIPNPGMWDDFCSGAGSKGDICWDDRVNDLNGSTCGANCGWAPYYFVAYFPDNYDAANFPSGENFSNGHWVPHVPSGSDVGAVTTKQIGTCPWEDDKYFAKYWAEGSPKFRLGREGGSAGVSNGGVYGGFDFEWVPDEVPTPTPPENPTEPPSQPPGEPTPTPTCNPAVNPSCQPTPTCNPSINPSCQPTRPPTPSCPLTMSPSMNPSCYPTTTPARGKEFQPTGVPTTAPRRNGPPGSNTSYTWVCLKAQKSSSNQYGEARLTGEGFPKNQDIFIVSCVQEPSGFKCTTGNDGLDGQLNIGRAVGHEFGIGTNPIKLTSTSNIDVTVISTTRTVTTHVFYGVYVGTPDDFPGDASSIQWGTFGFSQDYKKCVAIHWDPYGRVFDSQSLEPMAGVNISILNENKTKTIQPGLTNPILTDLGGIYKFFVEAGRYVLSIKPPSTHTFTSNPKLNPNYSKVYYNLYSPGEVIVENGVPVHRDIPLDPGNNPPYYSDIKSLSFSILPVSGSTKTEIVGQVSHPLATVAIYQAGNKIGEGKADDFGFYRFFIDNKQIDQSLPLVPLFTKPDFNKSNTSQLAALNDEDSQVLGASIVNDKSLVAKLIKFVSSIIPVSPSTAKPSITTSASVNPIPRYIEGFIYQPSGERVSNAQVNVVLTMSNKVYYQTSTNTDGLLSIKPENLPIFPYYLEVTIPDQQSFTVTTQEFINKNKTYLEQNDINLVTGQRMGERVR